MKQNYDKEKIILLVKDFILKNKRDPASCDFGKNNLPTTKTIERKFGGLRNLRKELGLLEDHRKGENRKKILKIIRDRERKYHTIVYKNLLKFFPEIAIHIESNITDDQRSRTDFKIFAAKDTIFFVDTFFPSTEESFKICVNNKKNIFKRSEKYITAENYKFIFVNLNEKIDRNKLTLGKDLSTKIMIIDYPEFLTLCEKYRTIV